jgi:tryptophan-rich sensory protein
MVRRSREAVIQSAELDFWAGLGRAVCDDGLRLLSDIEIRGGRLDDHSIVLFLIQITINAAWSWIFFAGHNPQGGFLTILALLLALAATVLSFWQIDPIASCLLWPYFAWVAFAALLNAEIARLNHT